jgi:hypothetical protein
MGSRATLRGAMTTVCAEWFRAPVDGLTRARIEDVLDVHVPATIDAPDPMEHAPCPALHGVTEANLECGRLALRSASNSELRRHRYSLSGRSVIHSPFLRTSIRPSDQVRWSRHSEISASARPIPFRERVTL